ncbi:MAG TPA: hypothetical protein VFG36_07700 [Methanoregula sp.]|nr:hypothetical protein [Methanoregula sp.]
MKKMIAGFNILFLMSGSRRQRHHPVITRTVAGEGHLYKAPMHPGRSPLRSMHRKM